MKYTKGSKEHGYKECPQAVCHLPAPACHCHIITVSGRHPPTSMVLASGGPTSMVLASGGPTSMVLASGGGEELGFHRVSKTLRIGDFKDIHDEETAAGTPPTILTQSGLNVLVVTQMIRAGNAIAKGNPEVCEVEALRCHSTFASWIHPR